MMAIENKNVLGLGRVTDLREFMLQCASVAQLDVDEAVQIAHKMIRNNIASQQLLDLENRWYASLESGKPDYSVYCEPYYFCDIWACWVKYSRRYLKMILADNARYGSPQTVFDLGCGFGYTTAALKEIFPHADVYGTNITSSSQWKLAEQFSQQHNFHLIDESACLPIFHKGPSLVFASEYFEHFESPLIELMRVIIEYSPTWLIVANSFTGRAIGHFNQYKGLHGEIHSNKKIGRLFTKTLKSLGYRRVSTTYWNNRPQVWVKLKPELDFTQSI